MKEVSRKILLLSVCNLLWGLIPWPAFQLFLEFSSFTVIFARFLMMAAIMLGIVGIILLWLRIRNGKSANIQVRHVFRYLIQKNPEFYFRAQWIYLLIVAVFGLNLMTILFFYCLKTIGAITTSIGVIISLILVSSIKWGMGKEEISGFKIIYLITLIIATVILGIVSQLQSSSGGFSAMGIIVVAFYGIALAFFVLSSGADRMSNSEYQILRAEPQYKLFRVFLKLGVLSLFSVVTYIPLLLIMQFLFQEPALQTEITHFFAELPKIGQIIGSWNGMALIIGCTILPYTLYYLLSTSWPKSTSFDLWVGVLQLIEPIINLVLGITVLNEIFPVEWLLVIIFFMLIAIFTKYVSETHAQINAILLLKIEPQRHLEIMKECYRIKASREVRSLIGDYDIMIDLQFATSTAMNRLISQKISQLPGLKRYEILLVTTQDIDRAIPDLEKGSSVSQRIIKSQISPTKNK
ncbi:MAG: Lrp/AsnC ligand binding domain-containing protein [Promethearchaeota archaeon]